MSREGLGGSAGLDGVFVREVSADVCQRLIDVWILLAGPEVVSGASQGFSDVEEMRSIHVREQLCLKLLNIPDVPPNPRLQPVQQPPHEPSNRHPRTLVSRSRKVVPGSLI